MDDQLGNLIEPKPIPFTFTAPGWYVVGGLVMLLLIGLVWLLIRQYKLNRYRKHALLLLADTEKKYTNDQAFDLLVYEADLLIKRIAMSRYGRQNVSGLRDGQWTEFINRTWHEKSFNEQDEVLLNQTIYQTKKVITADEAQAFTQKAKQWIKKHKLHINAV